MSADAGRCRTLGRTGRTRCRGCRSISPSECGAASGSSTPRLPLGVATEDLPSDTHCARLCRKSLLLRSSAGNILRPKSDFDVLLGLVALLTSLRPHFQSHPPGRVPLDAAPKDPEALGDDSD